MSNRRQKSSTDEARDAVRKRYQFHTDPEHHKVISAKKQIDYYDNDVYQRVAVYVRVSTDSAKQTSSYEIQRQYYEEFVTRHPLWTLVEVYADEGISGTSLAHRDAFNRMITDCKAGKIDLIITKSVSRFARNILICIGLTRELAELSPPVGVFFEMESIFSLKDDSQMALAFQATMAQEESHVKSRSQNTSLAIRAANGILLTPELYGYCLNEERKLVINPEEAPTVKLIFYMYLYGYSTNKIAETLTALGRPTYNGKSVWSPGTIIGMLRNERHCGEVLTGKTWTPNYIDHKVKPNRGNIVQHRYALHHEAIISRDDFIAVQHMLANAKYGNKSILPNLCVITEGSLKGFVTVNPRWAGFKANSYLLASGSAYSDSEDEIEDKIEISAETGDFDMRGFEMVRTDFFDNQRRLSVSMYDTKMKFSSECIRKFGNVIFVELLIHPTEKKLAVRATSKSNRSAIAWSRVYASVYYPRDISGAAFIGTLYDICGWNPAWKYRLNGIYHKKDDEAVIIFDMSEPEIFIPAYQNPEVDCQDGSIESECEATPLVTSGKRIKVIPEEWAKKFGHQFYERSAADANTRFTANDDWDVGNKGTSFEIVYDENGKVSPTVSEELRSFILSEINTGAKKEANEDE